MAEKDMEIARLQAGKAVLLQALAQKARDGEQEWAQRWLKRMDQAMLDVKPEDLVTIHVPEVTGR